MANTKEEIHAEALRICEDCLYSSKGHYNDAALWGRLHYILGVPSAALAALASVSAFAIFDESGVLTGILALLVAILTSVNTVLKPNAVSCQHSEAAGRYLALRNRARMFANLAMRLERAPDTLYEELQKLAAERDELNTTSPMISGYAYRKAKEGIEGGEATYAVDVEDKG